MLNKLGSIDMAMNEVDFCMNQRMQGTFGLVTMLGATFVLTIYWRVPNYDHTTEVIDHAMLLMMLPRLQTIPVQCDHLYGGNRTSIKTAKVARLQDDLNFKTLTKNCETFKASRGYLTLPVSDEEEKYPLAFSIIMYKDAQQAERLLRAIYRPQNTFCIHVDRNSQSKVIEEMTSVAHCFDNVFMARDAVDVTWGTFSVLEAELLCMKQLLAKSIPWKYFINLTGQEFPLKTNLDLVHILKAINGSNMVSYDTTSRKTTNRWKEAAVPAPGGIQPLKGSTHVVLNRGFVDFIIHNKTAQKFIDWLHFTRIPDELLFTTLNGRPELKAPGAYTGDIRFLSDLSHNSTERYKVWAKRQNETGCGGKIMRAICILGVNDLTRLSQSPSLFANKFVFDYEWMTLRCLEELHYNKTRQDILGQSDGRLDMNFYKSLPQVKQHVPSGLEITDA